MRHIKMTSTHSEISDAFTDDACSTLGQGELVRLGGIRYEEGDKIPERTSIEPYFSALLQVEHLNLLVGAGLTLSLAHIASFKECLNMEDTLRVDDKKLQQSIENAARQSARETGRGTPNLEDRLRIAHSVAEGLKHIDKDKASSLTDAIDKTLQTIKASILDTEHAIRKCATSSSSDAQSVHSLLVSFLSAFAGRTPTRDRLHVFTTNYDRVLEWGAELAGLRIVDKFVGSLQPVFRSSQLQLDYFYSPPGSIHDPRHLDGVFRFTKLHGSIDWRYNPKDRRVMRDPLPFGSSGVDEVQNLIIFPNAAKDLETTYYPFADLFRDFSGAVCRPHSVLITYGYSFGDSHINRIISDMLTTPSTHLLIISYDDTHDRIANFMNNHQYSGQISCLIGPNIANLKSLVDIYLPDQASEFLSQQSATNIHESDIASHPQSPHPQSHDLNN